MISRSTAAKLIVEEPCGGKLEEGVTKHLIIVVYFIEIYFDVGKKE